MQRHENGFSLVELLVTLAIFSIVMVIATGSYSAYMTRALRSDGTSLLMRVAAAQERYYLNNNSYAGADAEDLEKLGFPIPDGENAYKSDQGLYKLTIVPHANGLQVGYTATVSPADGSGQVRDTDCVEFSIDARGSRTSSPKAADICWR